MNANPPTPSAGVPPVAVPGGGGRRWSGWLVGLALVGMLALLRFQEPHGQYYFPRCALYSATGLQCPGCGGLRAAHALLNGDLAAAWRLNPLAVLLLPVCGWVATVFVARRFGRRLPNPFAAPWMIGAMTGAAVVFGIVRNL